jgi:hypothetical protein
VVVGLAVGVLYVHPMVSTDAASQGFHCHPPSSPSLIQGALAKNSRQGDDSVSPPRLGVGADGRTCRRRHAASAGVRRGWWWRPGGCPGRPSAGRCGSRRRPVPPPHPLTAPAHACRTTAGGSASEVAARRQACPARPATARRGSPEPAVTAGRPGRGSQPASAHLLRVVSLIPRTAQTWPGHRSRSASSMLPADICVAEIRASRASVSCSVQHLGRCGRGR